MLGVVFFHSARFRVIKMHKDQFVSSCLDMFVHTHVFARVHLYVHAGASKGERIR